MDLTLTLAVAAVVAALIAVGAFVWSSPRLHEARRRRRQLRSFRSRSRHAGDDVFTPAAEPSPDDGGDALAESVVVGEPPRSSAPEATPSAPSPAPPARRAAPPTPSSAPPAAAAPASQRPAPSQHPLPARPAGAVPRSQADLRVGPLAGRTFETPQQFAVAAVLEGGYDIETVARLFRLQPWRLSQLVNDALRR